MRPHTQPVRALQLQKVRQVANGGGQRPTELVLFQRPADHVGMGAKIGQARLPTPTKTDHIMHASAGSRAKLAMPWRAAANTQTHRPGTMHAACMHRTGK